MLNSVDEETFLSIFDYSLGNSSASLDLDVRKISHSNKIMNPMNKSDLEKENKIAREKLIYLYLYIFYGKNPGDFKTETYKKESERFNRTLDSLPNSKDVKLLIEDILDGKQFDSYDFVTNPNTNKLLNKMIIGNLISPLEANNITFHNILIPHTFIADTRIYLNPSAENYEDIVTFLQKEAALQEVNLGFKTRLGEVGYADNDNLILYTTSKDVAKVVAMLDKYEKLNKDKISTFGTVAPVLATLDDKKWYGVCLNPQGVSGNIASVDTYNDFVDITFNRYIFQVIYLENFMIATAHNPTDRVKIFMEFFDSLGDKFKSTLPPQLQKDYPQGIAKQLALTLCDPKLAGEFQANLIDISEIVGTSNKLSEEYSTFSEEKRRGLSPDHYRRSMETDTKLLANQLIPIKLKNGMIIKINRYDLEKILQSPTFAKCIKRYYQKNPKEIETSIGKAKKLWDHIHHNLYKFADKTHTNLTPEAARNMLAYDRKKSNKK